MIHPIAEQFGRACSKETLGADRIATCRKRCICSPIRYINGGGVHMPSSGQYNYRLEVSHQQLGGRHKSPKAGQGDNTLVGQVQTSPQCLTPHLRFPQVVRGMKLCAYDSLPYCGDLESDYRNTWLAGPQLLKEWRTPESTSSFTYRLQGHYSHRVFGHCSCRHMERIDVSAIPSRVIPFTVVGVL